MFTSSENKVLTRAGKKVADAMTPAGQEIDSQLWKVVIDFRVALRVLSSLNLIQNPQLLSRHFLQANGFRFNKQERKWQKTELDSIDRPTVVERFLSDPEIQDDPFFRCFGEGVWVFAWMWDYAKRRNGARRRVVN